MKVCKLSVCKEPTLCQSLHENVSESLLHSLFLHKTIQLSPFDLQSTPRFPPFYKLVTSIAFSTNYSIHSHVCNIDTMILQFQWDDKLVRHFTWHSVYYNWFPKTDYIRDISLFYLQNNNTWVPTLTSEARRKCLLTLSCSTIGLQAYSLLDVLSAVLCTLNVNDN